MVDVNEVPVTAPALPIRRRVPLRCYLLGRAGLLMITSMAGAALFSFWFTSVAISPLTIAAPLVVPITVAVRRYADFHRRGAQYLLGTPVRSGYRATAGRGPLARVWTIERDPASWRDLIWCLLHAIVACVTAALNVALFLGSILYLIYPFLFWVTPERVFGRPFGGLVHLHTVAQAAGMMPIAVVLFGLWWALCIPLTRAELALTQALLGSRRAG